jgi:outer membrane protein TolC
MSGLLLVSLGLLAPVQLAGQGLPGADSLLARLTTEAIVANPSLEASRANVRAAAARVRPAGALPDPMLSVGVMNLTLPRFAFRESDFTEVDVELSQEFPWPGTLSARTAAARADARGAQADLASRRREIAVRAAELYYRLRYLVTARTTLEQQRNLLVAGVEISTARYASTTASQSDPLQARVALARLDAEEADLGSEEETLRAELRALRNVTGPDSLVVQPIKPATVLAERPHKGGLEKSAPPADSLLEHPRLLARQSAIEAAEQSARVEALGTRPDFTFMTRYGARPLGSDFFSAFVGVRLPLFAGRKQSRLAEAARNEAEAARAGLAEERAALTAELRRTLAQVRAGEERLRLLVDKVVPAAEASTEATLRSYRVGQVEFLSVLGTEDALYRARLDAAQVAAEHLIHLVMIEQLLAREATR